MARSVRLRSIARGVLALWVAASVGEGLAATCCALLGAGHPPPPSAQGAGAHGAGGHGAEGTEHGPALRHAAHEAPHRTEQRHCPTPQLRVAAAIPAKAAELPLPRAGLALPPRSAGRPFQPRAVRAGTLRPRAPPADILRLNPRLRI